MARLKPLDIVRTPSSTIAVVTEVNPNGDVSVDFLENQTIKSGDYNAWWPPNKLTLLDSIPKLLADAMAHPFGENGEQGSRFFSLKRRK